MSKFSEVIDESVPEEDQAMVSLAAMRYLNSVGGQRPSDAARSEVSSYLSMGAAKYREQFERVRREERGR